MRYIRKVKNVVEEAPAVSQFKGQTIFGYNQSSNEAMLLEAGYLKYTGALPLSRLDIIDGKIVELPEPEATAEEKAAGLLPDLQLRAAMQAIPLDDDATALTMSPICPEWQSGIAYNSGEILRYSGMSYRVIQAVLSLEHQPPGSEGMLAIYRPIDPGSSGETGDPIAFTLGMDVSNGLLYSYEGAVYLAKADMKPCVWAPGTVGVWQWEKAE